MLFKEDKGYLPQTAQEYALSEPILDDKLLWDSIRRSKHELLCENDKIQYVLDFIGSDDQLKDTIAELEAIN